MRKSGLKIFVKCFCGWNSIPVGVSLRGVSHQTVEKKERKSDNKVFK